MAVRDARHRPSRAPSLHDLDDAEPAALGAVLKNLVLRYDPTVKGKDLLNDLRHLLKLSNIG